MSEARSPWLSIVTVVKDDPGGFRRTAQSLQGTRSDGVQWVVIDSSADKGEVPAIIEELGQRSTYSWEPPAGVYPAMNMGLARADGDYVWFLNGGDELAGVEALEVILRATQGEPTWLYGQVTFVGVDGRRTTPVPFDYKSERKAHFSRGRFPPHQGTVVRTEVLKELGGFDTGYRITADYAAMLSLSLLADPVEIPSVVAIFYDGGLSTTSWRESLAEFHRARVQTLNLEPWRRVADVLVTVRLGATIAAGRLVGKQS